MRWSDEALLLSARKYGENSAVARIFALTHGVYSGVFKGAFSKSNRGVLQSGNVLTVTWQARLSEHLGSFKIELLKANAALVMSDNKKLLALASTCALLESSLPERHPYPRLYKEFREFLHGLHDNAHWLEAYVKLEMTLLAESGFGLDLGHCAATGKTNDLIYVSPKSGRAVCREAGEPYKEKLLALPSFLRPGEAKKTMPETTEILAGLRLTGYFLEHWLAEPHGKKLPAARQRLMITMKEQEENGSKIPA